jgi:hypothetical protein
MLATGHRTPIIVAILMSFQIWHLPTFRWEGRLDAEMRLRRGLEPDAVLVTHRWLWLADRGEADRFI